jgi:hypothetical protein
MPFRIILTAFLLVASLATLSSAPGFVTCAWSQGADPIAQGNDLYNQGKFKEAADLLKGAIDKGEVKPADLGAARELLARSMVKADRRGEARETFKAILRKDGAYRPDPNKVPPDEVAVFDEALRDYQAEQIEQGKRIPASIGGIFGYGMFKPKDVNGAISEFGTNYSLGNAKEIKGASEYGGSVRFPLRPKLSLDLEMSRFWATASQAETPSSTIPGADYRISSFPIVASIYYSAFSAPKLRVNVFGGLGPLVTTELSVKVPITGLGSISVSSDKTGIYAHAGGEVEYLIMPRLSLSGRVLGRYANAGKIISDASLKEGPFAPFVDKSVSFTGLAFNIGLRAYIGY